MVSDHRFLLLLKAAQNGTQAIDEAADLLRLIGGDVGEREAWGGPGGFVREAPDGPPPKA